MPTEENKKEAAAFIKQVNGKLAGPKKGRWRRFRDWWLNLFDSKENAKNAVSLGIKSVINSNAEQNEKAIAFYEKYDEVKKKVDTFLETNPVAECGAAGTLEKGENQKKTEGKQIKVEVESLNKKVEAGDNNLVPINDSFVIWKTQKTNQQNMDAAKKHRSIFHRSKSLSNTGEKIKAVEEAFNQPVYIVPSLRA